MGYYYPSDTYMIPVIICGGIGTKLWPESRRAYPKQFIPFFNGKSLFQLNWEALRINFAPQEIFLQTTAEQAKIATAQVAEIVSENIFIEPEIRNQGPATGFAAAQLFKKFPDEPFILVQADILRTPSKNFIEMMNICDRLARETGKYITGGIKPSHPVMGVDYLMPGRRISRASEVGVFEVDKFIWRSTPEETLKHIVEGALIHTNHTCMTPRGLLAMLEMYRPDWYKPLMAIINGADIATEYAKMPKGPLEEVTQKIHEAGESLVVELPFDWVDFGTWESVMNYVTLQGDKNLPNQNIEEIDASSNFIRAPKHKHVALVGVKDLIVVDTEDALLVCSKKDSGKVGEIVEHLKLQKKDHLL